MKFIVVSILDDSMKNGKDRLNEVLSFSLLGHEPVFIDSDELPNRVGELKDSRILFVIKIDEYGINRSFYSLISFLRRNEDALLGCMGAVLIDAKGDLYTKSFARELVYTANLSGCAFMGRPLVEASGSLINFTVLAKTGKTDLMGAYKEAASDLIKRLLSNEMQPGEIKNIAVIHASDPKISNTFALWELIKSNLPSRVDVNEVNLRNGSIMDCRGCPYDTCLHFGEQGGCFYGGPMVDEVYPALLKADTLMMLCPNYNDALSASLTAFINRLTALFRVRRFYDKRLCACIVSGYSGGELIAGQLIAALNMNKSFYLPPKFAIFATANDSGSLMNIPDIQQKAMEFVKQLIS